jgi:hypothetical protein
MLNRESLIEWAAHWVPDSPPGQRQRFTEALAAELKAWTPPAEESSAPINTSLGCLDPESSLDVFSGR